MSIGIVILDRFTIISYSYNSLFKKKKPYLVVIQSMLVQYVLQLKLYNNFNLIHNYIIRKICYKTAKTKHYDHAK